MNFIVGSEIDVEKHENPFHTEVFDEKSSAADEKKVEQTEASEKTKEGDNTDTFDLSDISHSKDIDREAIIAAAEKEAFDA